MVSCSCYCCSCSLVRDLTVLAPPCMWHCVGLRALAVVGQLAPAPLAAAWALAFARGVSPHPPHSHTQPGVNSQLKGTGELDAASITVLSALGVLFFIFAWMTVMEVVEFNEATARRDSQEAAERNEAVTQMINAERVRSACVVARSLQTHS